MTIETKHPARRVLAAIAADIWAILPESLEQIFEIASRLGDPEALAVKAGQRLESSPRVEVRDGVAILPVRGPIVRYADMFSAVSGATALSTLARDFQAALVDPAVSAIVLEMDSPGGQATGIHEFAAQVRAGSDIKPVTAYVGGAAASAAYWIAAAASRIVADPTARLGSIGVVSAFEKSGGDKLEIVSSRAPKKRVDPATDAGRAEVIRVLDALESVFVSDVAAFRGVSEDTVAENFGQGGVLVGSGAVAAGMADALGSLEGVLAELSVSRPLAGNLNAKEETMPNATKPDSGGGTTAATAPAAQIQTGSVVVLHPGEEAHVVAAEPTAADVLAVVDAFVGPEASASVTKAMEDARALGVPCSIYAAMAKRLGVPKAMQPDTANANTKATALTALTAALARPSAPGKPAEAEAAERDRILASIKAGGESRYAGRV